MPLAGHGLRPTALRRRAGRPQLKRDPLGGTHHPRTTAMVQQTPRATVQELYDAVHAQDWIRAVALADSESLTVWYHEERAALATLLLRPGERDHPFEASDTGEVTDILNLYGHVPIRRGNIGTLGALTSLGAADLLKRHFEVMEQLFGPDAVAERPVPFRIVEEVPENTDKAYVRYEGYIGIGGGMPERLEVRRRGDKWFYVLTPELTMPDLALVIGTTTPLRDS